VRGLLPTEARLWKRRATIIGTHDDSGARCSWSTRIHCLEEKNQMKIAQILLILWIAFFSSGCSSKEEEVKPEEKIEIAFTRETDGDKYAAFSVVKEEVKKKNINILGISLTQLDESLILARVDTGEKQLEYLVCKFVKADGQSYWKIDQSGLSRLAVPSVLLRRNAKRAVDKFKQAEEDANAGDPGDRPDY
jgi:hypothetical protein